MAIITYGNKNEIINSIGKLKQMKNSNDIVWRKQNVVDVVKKKRIVGKTWEKSEKKNEYGNEMEWNEMKWSSNVNSCYSS